MDRSVTRGVRWRGDPSAEGGGGGGPVVGECRSVTRGVGRRGDPSAEGGGGGPVVGEWTGPSRGV